MKGLIICKRDALNEIMFIVSSSSKVLAQERLKNHLKARHSKINFPICLLIPDCVGLALDSTFLISFLERRLGPFI